MDYNPNRLGSVEYAIRHAIICLGAEEVAKVLGCSPSLLYKCTGAHPSRGLPDITLRQAIEITNKLKARSKRRRSEQPRTEHFSDCFRLAGRSRKPHGSDLNHCLSFATGHVGTFAQAICQVTDAKSELGSRISVTEFELLTRTGRIAISAISDVLYCAELLAFESADELARHLMRLDSEMGDGSEIAQ